MAHESADAFYVGVMHHLGVYHNAHCGPNPHVHTTLAYYVVRICTRALGWGGYRRKGYINILASAVARAKWSGGGVGSASWWGVLRAR